MPAKPRKGNTFSAGQLQKIENQDCGKPTKEAVNVARQMKNILQTSRAKSLSTGPAEQFSKCGGR